MADGIVQAVKAGCFSPKLVVRRVVLQDGRVSGLDVSGTEEKLNDGLLRLESARCEIVREDSPENFGDILRWIQKR